MGDSDEIIHMKIDGKWLRLTSDIIVSHPGGPVIRQYANADATHMFEGFHEGSSQAFKQLEVLKKTRVVTDKDLIARLEANLAIRDDEKDINVSTYDVSVEEHNTHHAATNVVEHDGDIDLSPLFALIPSDLFKYKAELEHFLLKFIPYQHLYFTLSLPLLRVSWTSQSIQWVLPNDKLKEFEIYQKNHRMEAWGLFIHWSWVFFQLYCLPDWSTRISYFLISQFLAGFLVAHVVTFNHNSVDKYPAHSRLLNNFSFLQIMTTRNMESSPFIDWLWGGLNFQIEHHLFPTMPRCNLGKCSMLVRDFCKENGLPYMVDGYWAGYQLNLKQLENVANLSMLMLHLLAYPLESLEQARERAVEMQKKEDDEADEMTYAID
ncbi:hypothetical protein WR25_22276 [Diploscapter pachys]|uniref:Fatty acid desaturase domain-containing protein n=1 Tax=Diploscapter pachys TaxID=2018661 RepID=A0A2A2L5D5_9BILA|nr:hypothetical protein WR25_22276 [Diploscapter pachys]